MGDNGRRKAVDDSVRMYRERAKANRLAAAAESSGEDQGTTAEVLERAATNMDAMRVLNVEYNSMTPEQKKVLDARIQEAEDEEDNYRSERAKMKAMGSRGETKRLPRSTSSASTYTPWAPEPGQIS